MNVADVAGLLLYSVVYFIFRFIRFRMQYHFSIEFASGHCHKYNLISNIALLDGVISLERVKLDSDFSPLEDVTS